MGAFISALSIFQEGSGQYIALLLQYIKPDVVLGGISQILIAIFLIEKMAIFGKCFRPNEQAVFTFNNDCH
jgi:hypothetical protein